MKDPGGTGGFMKDPGVGGGFKLAKDPGTLGH